MKNLVIIILVIGLILLVIGVLEEYNLIDWQWKELAILTAGLAGPFQFIKSKLDQKEHDKNEADREFQYKTLPYNDFVKRKMEEEKISNAFSSSSNNIQTKEKNTVRQESFDTENTVG